MLEHIEDDEAILRELYDSLIPGGLLGVYVPAHMILWTGMDESVGHFRRYSKKEIKSKMLLAGFNIESSQYDESIGFLALLLLRLIGYKRIGNLGSAKSLIFYDKFVYPVSRLLDLLGFRIIAGKNLLVIGRRGY